MPHYDPEHRLYPADDLRVTDGDTIRMLVDHGMRVRSEQAIRLAGVDTWELFSGAHRDKGRAAKEFVMAWLDEHRYCDATHRFPFILTTQRDKQSLDRWVGEVHCRVGHALAPELVAEGHEKDPSVT